MTDTPLISVGLAVLNGLPHLRQSIEALRRQTYRNFELLVQDGGSTDGSLDFLNAIDDLPHIDVVSEPDSGLAQAWGRTMKRAKGEMFVFASCDELLEPDAFETFVTWRKQHPTAVMVYGAMRMMDDNHRLIDEYAPPPFDLVRFMKCEIFGTVGGYIDIANAKNEFFYDETLVSSPDYDFFLRVGSRFGPKAFVAKDKFTMTALKSETSMSFRPSSYEHFRRDKTALLERFLAKLPPSPQRDALQRDAACSILLWLAESTYSVQGFSDLSLNYAALARDMHPQAFALALECVGNKKIDGPTKADGFAVGVALKEKAAKAGISASEPIRFASFLFTLTLDQRRTLSIHKANS